MRKLLPALFTRTDRHMRMGSRRAGLLVLTMVTLLTASFIVPAGEAEAATLWTSTLNVKNLGGGSRGCDGSDGDKSCARAMSDNTFELGSQTYTVNEAQVYTHTLREGGYYVRGKRLGTTKIFFHYLKLDVTPQIPKDVRDGLSVRFGSLDVPLDFLLANDWRDEPTGESGSRFHWRTPARLPWNTGDSISVKILDEPVKPMWPRDFTATRGNRAATLNWQPPVADGNTAITRYEYRHKTTGNYPATWTPVPDGTDADTGAGNERSVTVSGLTNATAYSFELHAVNGVGNGPSWHAEATPNARPTASDRTITVSEDNIYLFTIPDWGFSDEDEGDSLEWVMVERFPPEETGIIQTADDGWFPRFITARNWNGSTNLTFRVSDGKDESESAYTMTINVAPVNDRARGRPTISGGRQVGQTLTASAAGISDVDGLPDSFDYQWLRVDADGVSNPVAVSGATTNSYTPEASDVGKRFRFRVNFTDQDGHSEELTSDPTGTVQASGTINAAPTGSDGTYAMEEDTDYVFKVADFGFADTNAGDVLVSVKVVTPPAAGFLLLNNAVQYAGAELLSGDIDTGRLVFKPQPNAYSTPYDSFTYKMNDGTAETALATIIINITPVNDPATGKLKIVLDSRQTFAQASKAGITDVDGMSNANFVYQWTRRHSNGTVTEGDNSATAFTQISKYRDPGTNLRWSMTFTDDYGSTETVYSDWMTLFPNAPPTEAPIVQGVPAVSDAGEDDVWTPGEKVEVTLTFNERMTVLAYDGVPSIGLNLGGTEARSAEYDRGNSTNTLVFSYTLTEADGTHTSMVVPPNSLALNGGVIQSRESRFDAALTHDGKTAPVLPAQQAGARGAGLLRDGPANALATGAPGIDGSPRTGETLTATTSSVEDGDGIAKAVFAYQWIRRDLDTATDMDIEGATDTTYTVTTADQGKALKVEVTFTDDAGNGESVTSASTAAVKLPLTAAVHDAPESHDGQSVFTFEVRFSEESTLSYKTLRDHAFTVTGGEVTNARRLERHKNRRWEISVRPSGNPNVTVTLPATTDCTTRGAICTARGGMLSAGVELVIPGPSSQESSQENSAATGAPTITGTAQVGETLTANTSGIADSDGLSNTTFDYQWLADAAAISDATGTSYTPAASDAGKTIRVGVAFTDDGGNEESLTSAATAAVAAAANSAPTGAPTISGTAQVGETLTAGTSGIADADGLTSTTFAYQWIADDADISAATGSSYTLTSSEEGEAIKVRVTFTDDGGNAESLTSTATAAVASANSAPTGAPNITGTAQVGETLTISTTDISDADGLSNATFTYQWIAGEIDINGAAGSSYTLTASEQGKAIRVRVTFDDDAGNAESVTSQSTEAVVAKSLTAGIHDQPTSHDGQSGFTFELRFSETPKDDFSYVTLRDHAFTVTGGTVTNARRLEPGKNVRWEITVQPSGNAGVTIVLPVTTDCAADGAICTGDGRMLSERVELAVSGPSG